MAKHFDDINVNIEKETDDFIKVIAEPFERGHGVTIGNALRRSLLTSVPGSAITSLHIEGVSHEFTNIKGVKEDISDIILNLKDVRFKAISDGPELTSVTLEGPCNFTASDIGKTLAEFEVLNPEAHIATITDKITLSVDLRVSRGKGYTPAENNKRKDDTLETIPIDSIFNPINNVKWEVQPIETSIEGQERLILEVCSDGSSTPKDAINHAADISRQHLAFFMFNDSSAIKAINEEEVNEALELKTILSKSIDEMELSVRSHNCLQAAGIETIGSLVSKDESVMLKYKNFGRKSLTELQEKLGELNLHFGMDISKYMEA
ncbi:MAG: DNA-directed RNA polymerase subunit alpha [Candidatus Marinimicrobia bacterium]|nr:DNA-directed RNA polymerase subunit alpha [Candidatus Neomarinimicrobiota bacterium]|tara:strand:- start:912 stop:1874 length:963 start_codon:yes stop_codon:yes gene_type:complete